MLPSRVSTTAVSNGTVVAMAVLVVASTMAMTGVAVTTGGQQVAQQAEPGGFSGVTNLSDADAELHGAAANDTAGRSVANAGDVNGDGVDDLIVGAPHNDTGGEDAGAAYLVYGPVDAAEVDLEDADVKLVGASADDLAGWSVSGAGDVNDDGYADVVVGAPNNDTTGSNTGAAYVVYGGDSLPSAMNLADADATLQGTEADAHAGWSVSNASDADGDDAVLVGSPYANDEAGAAYLVPGDEVNGTETLDDAAAATMEGESPGDLAGWSVSGAGDVVDDGTSDVVVGAMNWSGETNETASAGAAYVVSGDVDGTVGLASADLVLTGASDRDRAGWSVSNAGDVNDDGVADVVVGAPYHDADAVNATGAAYVVYGGDDAEGERSLENANRTLTGAREGDLAGWSVSDAGPADVTCDGVDDLLVGAPGHDANGDDSGAAYVVAGDESASDFQSLGDAAASFYGESADDRAGHAVSGAGNATDDGGSDVVVGAPYNDSDGQTDAGAAYLLESSCGDAAEERDTETETEDETDAPMTETETETETEMDVVFSGCEAVRFYGVEAGDEVTVTAIATDGVEETLTFSVDEDGLEGQRGNEYFEVDRDEFADEYGSVEDGWKLFTADGESNDNVVQNDQGAYVCGGPADGGAGNQPDGAAGNQPVDDGDEAKDDGDADDGINGDDGDADDGEADDDDEANGDDDEEDDDQADDGDDDGDVGDGDDDVTDGDDDNVTDGDGGTNVTDGDDGDEGNVTDGDDGNVTNGDDGNVTNGDGDDGTDDGDGGAGNQPEDGNAGLGLAQVTGLFGFAGASVLALKRRN